VAVDSLGFGQGLGALPEQLAAAHEVAGTVPASALPDAAAFDRIVTLGMGGSGIAGNVLQAVGTVTLPIPITVLKHYRTPAFVNERTLAFALSYSGDTEETIEMARGAVAAGATLVAVSRGGELARLAEESGSLHVPCPDDILMPRLALGALVAPLLVVLFRMGLLPEAHAGLLRAQQQLAHRREQCKPSIEGDRNPARELARKIGRTIPIIYGSGGLGGVAAMRWKQSVTENAKAPAFWNEYPELDHNEVCGWGQHGDVTRQVFSLVLLRHSAEHPQTSRRFGLVAENCDEVVAEVHTVEASGTGTLAQMLDLVMLGDFVTLEAAVQAGIDPGPVPILDYINNSLRD
jgi:glucose/mannose-6-phosphate isomerase